MPRLPKPHHVLRLIVLTGLLPFGFSVLLGACSREQADPPAAITLPATPRLASVPNFRDLAGADAASVYHNHTGRALRRGVFYRADVLTADDADFARLNALGIRAVYDLRTPGEIAQTPDRLPYGADYVNINLIGVDEIDASAFTAPGVDPARAMEKFERQLVSDPEIRQHLAQLLTQMASTEGAQVFHCTAGKDRTGWVAALLHVIAGVPEKDIMKDYLLTNAYTGAKQAQLVQKMREEHGDAMADAMAPVMGVQESFLRAGFDEAINRYGSMQAYISIGLGLDDKAQAALREKLLE